MISVSQFPAATEIVIVCFFPFLRRRFNFSFHNRTSGSSIKGQVLDLKTLPVFSPLKISVKFLQLAILAEKHTFGQKFTCLVPCCSIAPLFSLTVLYIESRGGGGNDTP